MTQDSGSKNAIEKRIDYLTGLWLDFTNNSDARLLRWVVKDEDANILDAFFELQNEEGGSDLSDLFVKFDAVFDSPNEYGFKLIENFKRKYEEIRIMLSENEIDNTWMCPEPSHNISDIEYFVQCCISFRQHYEGLVPRFVPVIVPKSIINPDLWQIWLVKLLQKDLSETIRICVVDNVDSPYLEGIAQQPPELAKTIKPELDMQNAIQELASKAGGNGPSVEFRRIFVDLTMLAGQSDGVRLEQKAEEALKIAKDQNWPSMQVAVHMLLGAAHFKANRISQALDSYSNARQVAEIIQAQGDSIGTKLIVQSQLGYAAVLFSISRYAEAAEVYEEAAIQAQIAQDQLMMLESWRMASYCYDQSKKIDDAWRTGWTALEAAEKIDVSVRQSSTLPYIGQVLMKLVRYNPYQDKKELLLGKMNELAGSDWEKRIPQGI